MQSCTLQSRRRNKGCTESTKISILGCKKIIIGTAANEELLSKLPKEKVLIAIDSKDGYIATHGWTKTTTIEPLDFVKRFNNLCSGFLYTVIENEGMMQGADIDSIKLIRAATTKELIAAGGICSVDEIVKLQKWEYTHSLVCAFTQVL